MLTRAALAKMIDHTLLKPEATPADVAVLIAEAQALGVLAVCLSPSMLPVDAEGLVVAATVGFPSGKHDSRIKAAEAALAVGSGADEVDMVIDVGAACAGDFESVRRDIAAVRHALPDAAVLKVILETALLGDGAIRACCEAAHRAGADFVKTSTGFHPAGGATVHAIEVMADAVGGKMGVKASGGIRDLATVRAMIDAGATRLGLSRSASILRELDPPNL